MNFPRRIVFYDGSCNLCHASVRFIIARDPKTLFRFASLDSRTAAEVLSSTDRIAGRHGSVVLLDDRRIYTRSDAALRILALLGGPWKMLTAARWIPRPVRDFFYDLIARYRHRWSRSNATCPIPDPKEAERFLN